MGVVAEDTKGIVWGANWVPSDFFALSSHPVCRYPFLAAHVNNLEWMVDLSRIHRRRASDLGIDTRKKGHRAGEEVGRCSQLPPGHQARFLC